MSFYRGRFIKIIACFLEAARAVYRGTAAPDLVIVLARWQYTIGSIMFCRSIIPWLNSSIMRVMILVGVTLQVTDVLIEDLGL